MRLLLICPSWGRACGIASYTAHLRKGLEDIGVASDVAINPAAVKRLLEGGGYDAVLLQHEYSLYYFNLVAVLTLVDRTKLPFVITMHNTDHRGWMGAQHLFLFKTRAKFVVHSEGARDNLLRGRPAPDASRLSVVPMGSPDYRETFGPIEQVRQEMGLPPDRFVVGFFGFAAEHKGIPNLVKALLQLPDVQGYISATVHPVNPLAVDAIYAQCGISRQKPAANRFENVLLLHERIPDEKFGRYQHAVDVIALPYAVHGASISTSMMAHEAIAAGRPVIATEVPYFSDLDQELLKIPDNSPATIARAIVTLRDDAELRRTLSDRAAAYAAAHTWPKLAQEYLALLR